MGSNLNDNPGSDLVGIQHKTYTQSLRTTNKQAAISQVTHFSHIKTADLQGQGIKSALQRVLAQRPRAG